MGKINNSTNEAQKLKDFTNLLDKRCKISFFLLIICQSLYFYDHKTEIVWKK